MRVGEPVFKKTFTKLLPKGARVFSRKHIKYARFTNSSGKIQIERTTKNGKKLLCETNHWYIRFDDHFGIRRVLKAYPDKGTCDYLYGRIQELINCLRRKEPIPADLWGYLGQNEGIREQLIKFGLLEEKPQAENLDDLVGKFAEYIKLKDRTQQYIDDVTRTLRIVFTDCKFQTWDDIDSDVVKRYLDERRDGGTGISKNRYNNVLKTVRRFCHWHTKRLRKTDKTAISPVEDLETLKDVQTDLRHQRRTLELEDYRRFLFAALTGDDYLGLSGKERNFIYRFGAETAMRKIDFMRLRVKDVDFDNAVIRIQAARIKNKTESEIYLRLATMAELKKYCKNKLPDAKVFNIPDRTEQMVKFDLANTAIKDSNGKVLFPAIPYEDKYGRRFDFHAACRYQGIALAALNPNTPENVRQKLSRHKTPAMLRHYAGAAETERQQRKALEALPDLTQLPQTQIRVKTGTDTDSLSNTNFINDTIRHSRTQGNKDKKTQSFLMAKNCDNEPLGGVLVSNSSIDGTCQNSEIADFPDNNKGASDRLVLYKFYSSDFDPKLQEVIKKWPSLSDEIKAAVLRMISSVPEGM